MNLQGALKGQAALNTTEMEAENKKLKQTVEELTTKCEKLESSGKDMERLMREQSGLMKALNVSKHFNLLIAHCIIPTLLMMCKEVVL